MTPSPRPIAVDTHGAWAQAEARLAEDLLKAAMVITHADAGHVQLRAGGPFVRTVAQTGLPRSFGPVVDGDPSARALWRRVLDMRRRIVVADLFEARHSASTSEDALRAVGLHATQASPIFASTGDLVGVLSTHTRRARTFSDDELAGLDALLERAADFLEQAPPAGTRRAGSASEDPTRLASDLAPRHAQLDLRVAVGQAVDETTARIREHGHELTVCLGADPAWVAGDQRRLIQVFASLLRNAVTHTPPSGKLSVFVHSSSGWAAVHVSDNGEGIPKEALDRIFARSAAGPDDPRWTRGELNLADARRLIELHDGDIVAHSDGLGQGSRFVVRLPVLAAYRSTRRA